MAAVLSGGLWFFFCEAEELVVRAVQTRGNGRTTRFLLFELSTVCMAGLGLGVRGKGCCRFGGCTEDLQYSLQRHEAGDRSGVQLHLIGER